MGLLAVKVHDSLACCFQLALSLPCVSSESSVQNPCPGCLHTAGDKRADVAQRAFNKPFAKITVNECGLL